MLQDRSGSDRHPRLRWTISAAAVLAALAATPALSQTLDSGTGLQPSLKLSQPPTDAYGAAPLPHPEALFPQLNNALLKYGTAILLDDVDEFDGIVSGRTRGSTNAGQYGLEWDQDWNVLAGVGGFETHALVVGRYGIPASRIFGDNLDPSQEIYGAGGNVAVHLVYAFGEETVAHGRVAIAAGRIPYLDDFTASPLYCNFQSNSLCGNPKASADNVNHSSYPDANWAIRARVRPIQQVYVQSGIYFDEDNIYSATDGFRSGFNFGAQHIDGETFPVETGWEPSFGPNHLPGHYKLGFAYDNVNHTSFYNDDAGGAYPISGLPAQVRKGGTTEWVLVDQMLLRQGPGATDGIVTLAGYVRNDPRYSTRQDQYFVGGIDRDFWKARPFDTIGALFSYTDVSNQLIKTEELQQALGEPITGGGGQFYDASTPGIQSHTMNIEVNYQIHVFRGVTFAPDFQYFIRPNAQGNLPNAALIGFKSHIELF